MKANGRPATVEELDHRGHPILHTLKSANRITKQKSSAQSPQKEKVMSNGVGGGYAAAREKSPAANFLYGKCSLSLPIEQMAKLYESYNRNNPLTIFSRSQDRSRERNEVPGCKFRKVFVTDETEVLVSSASVQKFRYVRLTAFISESDKDHTDPRIYVEQSVLRRGNGGKEDIIVHELTFGERIQTEIDYVFPDFGDEHSIFGKRALRLRIRSLDNITFQGYMDGASYYGYDRLECVTVNRYALNHGLTYSHKIRDLGGGPLRQQQLISFDPKDLQILLDAKQKTQKKSEKEDGLELLRLRIHGLGEYAEDAIHVGDLDLRVLYRPS